ncbi:MAG: homoserine dehydrogenase [Mogibacterium sp.]|nr:homoserine dehydrogenase [Mogibacterium sp.]
MKIAIMGFGTVGSGAYESLKNVSDVELVRILARHGRPGYEELDEMITPNIEDIVNDGTIDLVVETIGGIEPAASYVLACLNAGKHVVTANKNLISARFDELMAAAAANGVQLRFTSAVGGGIPWLHNLLRTRRCDEIISIKGIVNGTCNYILDSMADKGVSFDECLKIAQDLGYAEADPSSDIEGTDTLRKTVISSRLAFDTTITEGDIPCYGIDTIDSCDITWMKEKDLTCKLMMTARNTMKGVTACVEPVLLRSDSLESAVKTNNNLITLTAKNLGTQSFYGQGAGSLPTGESVVHDVMDIRDGDKTYAAFGDTAVKCCKDTELHRYYIRHDRMCEHISPLIDEHEEREGIFYCISKPITTAEMHEIGHHRKERGRKLFFARLPEE